MADHQPKHREAPDLPPFQKRKARSRFEKKVKTEEETIAPIYKKRCQSPMVFMDREQKEIVNTQFVNRRFTFPTNSQRKLLMKGHRSFL